MKMSLTPLSSFTLVTTLLAWSWNPPPAGAQMANGHSVAPRP
jgi:hypothetical protein